MPVGPFCPFRSSYSSDEAVNREMGTLAERGKGLAQRMAHIMLEAQMGRDPDPAVVRPLADEIRETAEMWNVAIARMRYLDDFQALEYFKLMQAHIARKGMRIEQVQALMAWQTDGMVAFCEGRTPPEIPSDLPTELLVGGTSGLTNMMGGAGAGLTAKPFNPDSDALKSDVIREEYVRLTADHSALIKMGENYRSFDPAGKAMFLKQVEDVETRWSVFFTRFQLMGQVNPEYVREANSCLQQVGMTVIEFRELLREAHDIMRSDAEQEAVSR